MESARRAKLVVDVSLPSERLDSFLRSQFPMVSRGAFQRLIEEGHVQVNGKPVKSTHAPVAGEVVDIFFPEPKSDAAQPEDLPLDILFEDSDLLVLNKPPGLVVHPSAGHEKHTLVNALLHHCAGKLSGIGGVARPGIVHRLDKDTSGCLVVAKTDQAHIHLTEQFQARGIRKVYHALLCGNLPSNAGEIRADIARHPTHRKRMAVTTGNGREAWTSYKVLKRMKHTTYVEALLHTGRTHQIRVHFQFLKCPLVGDITYGEKPNKKLKEQTGYFAPRQMLHAYEVEFVHPIRQKRLNFRAPLPEDFESALATLSS